MIKEIAWFLVKLVVALPVFLTLVLLRFANENYYADCLEDWWLHS